MYNHVASLLSAAICESVASALEHTMPASVCKAPRIPLIDCTITKRDASACM